MVMALRCNCSVNEENEMFGSLKIMEKYLVEEVKVQLELVAKPL